MAGQLGRLVLAVAVIAALLSPSALAQPGQDDRSDVPELQDVGGSVAGRDEGPQRDARTGAPENATFLSVSNGT